MLRWSAGWSTTPRPAGSPLRRQRCLEKCDQRGAGWPSVRVAPLGPVLQPRTAAVVSEVCFQPCYGKRDGTETWRTSRLDWSYSTDQCGPSHCYSEWRHSTLKISNGLGSGTLRNTFIQTPAKSEPNLATFTSQPAP